MKLRWLPPGIFVYGGGSSCPKLSLLIFSTTLNIIIEAVHVCLEVWLAKRRKGVQRYFSWFQLCRAMVVGLGVPILSSYLLARSSLETSWKAALGIFLMTPKAAPIIGLISGMVLGKGFGSQVLLIDTLVSIAGLTVNGNVLIWMGGESGIKIPAYITDVDRPAQLARIYLGSFLATVPGTTIGTLYFVTGQAIIPLILLAIFLKNSAFAKLGFMIWISWICFFAFFFATPFLMLWEIGWKALVKDKDRIFPPVRFFRRIFGMDPHWLAWLARYAFYWIWVGFSFTAFVGRWMFLVNMTQAAGDAFCPASLTPTILAGTGLTFAAVASNFVLRFYDLIL